MKRRDFFRNGSLAYVGASLFGRSGAWAAAEKTTAGQAKNMTQKAIGRLSRNKNGFVMQVEAGKVDWAAHANDTAALLYDQAAFDEAIKVAI